MDSRCPYCNQEAVRRMSGPGPWDNKTKYKCGTIVYKGKASVDRTERCFRTEITELKSQLAEMTRIRDEAWEDKYELQQRLGVAEMLLRQGTYLIAWPNTDFMKLKDEVIAFLSLGDKEDKP